MKTLKNLSVVLAAALVAGLVAGHLLQPRAVSANGEEEAEAAKVLVVDGVTLSLELEKTTCQAGKKPVLTLCAVNGADAAKKVTVDVVVAGGLPFEIVLSRSAPIATPEWKRRVPVELTAGATKRIRIEAEKPLTVGSVVTFHIRSTEKQPRDLVAVTLNIPLELPEAKVAQR